MPSRPGIRGAATLTPNEHSGLGSFFGGCQDKSRLEPEGLARQTRRGLSRSRAARRRLLQSAFPDFSLSVLIGTSFAFIEGIGFGEGNSISSTPSSYRAWMSFSATSSIRGKCRSNDP